MTILPLLFIPLLSLFVYFSSEAVSDDDSPYKDLFKNHLRGLHSDKREDAIKSLIRYVNSLETENNAQELVREWTASKEFPFSHTDKERMKTDLIRLTREIITRRNGERKKAEAQAAQEAQLPVDKKGKKGGKRYT